MTVQLLMGAVLSTVIALIAYHKRSLTPSGVAGAIAVGTVVFGCGGWAPGAVLVTFFVMSSALSHYRETSKRALATVFAKGGRRDFGQTLANGGVAALLALGSVWFADPVVLAAFLGAMATVNADTWATEIGVLARRPPRLLISWAPVERGTSGAVSPLGTLASTAGAATIALAAVAYLELEARLGGRSWGLAGAEKVDLMTAAALGGVAGSLVDSVLGATVQAMYHSSARNKPTERRVDADGTPNRLVRGWRWLGNDWVNFLSSLAGAAVAAALWAVSA